MTPLQIAAKTNYEAEWGPGSWDLVSKASQEKLCRMMRAALLALAECELPRNAITDGSNWKEKAELCFRTMLRSIANDTN